MSSLLQPVVVLENYWVSAYTYDWDFSIQQMRRFCEALGLRIRRTVCAMYRFNPDGSWVHRAGHAMTKHFPLKHLGWDRTVLIERPMSRREGP
jgi:hypothetical protein